MGSSKDSWRHRLRLWFSKDSSQQGLPGIVAPPASLTIQATSTQPQGNVATSTAHLSWLDDTSSPTEQLLQKAVQCLEDDERATIEQFLPSSLTNTHSTLEVIIYAAQKQRQKCEDERWSIRIGGRDLVLRSIADEVIHWLDRFKSVGDIAANADSVHIGLPWAGFRLLLEVFIKEPQQMAALLSGCETALYMASRLEAYIEFWSVLPSDATRNNLTESIIKLYTQILHFLAQALRIYQTPTWKRTATALWRMSDVVDFEAKAEGLAAKLERDASSCSRSITAQSQRIIVQLHQYMQQVQVDLRHHRHSIGFSLDRLHLKNDLDKIPYVNGAIFNSSDGVHTLCHPATRRDVLSRVQAWAQQPDGESIFWLYGGVGTGKSTISWTISQWLTELGGLSDTCLGASFYFKRGEGDRGSARRFFPTIIRQLITTISGLGILVAEAINFDPFIFDKALAEQFRQLILHPLQKLSVSSSRQPIVVVVVDALDECEKEIDIQIILKLWSQLSQLTCVCLRLFLTSRSDSSVQLGFQQMSKDHFQEFDLVSAIPADTIRNDLSVYFQASLCTIRQNYNQFLPGTSELMDSWPESTAIDQLVDIAFPLFIVAATICRLIGDLDFDPQESLDSILRNSNIGQISQWEMTYLPVLNHLTIKARDQNQKKKLYDEFRAVVGSLIFLAEPLSAHNLAMLIGESLALVHRRLAPLHSVLLISREHSVPIRTLHLSFREFLISEQAQNQPYGINEAGTHFMLGRSCLRVLSCYDGLRENICKFDYPGQPRHEVEITLINRCILPTVQYACQHWVYHTTRSGCQLKDDGEAHIFLKKHFLHWLEALSLMNRISEAFSLLHALQSCTLTTASKLTAFLEDAQYFLRANIYIIDHAPLQLYSSTIIFSPEGSLVRSCCGQIPSWIKQHPRTPNRWGPMLQLLEGHTSHVLDMKLSSNNSMLASCSSDSTIRLWDFRTGQEVLKLGGDGDTVTSISFSPDDSLLLSGSKSSMLSLWDIHTGQKIRQLTGHSDEVWAVAFSPDASKLVSGSRDRTVRIWCTQTGQEIYRLEGHCDRINAIAFSPDGLLLASGSDDQTICLWDTRRGQRTQRLVGHTDKISTVAFSSQRFLLASGSHDQTVRLWNYRTGQAVRTLEGHPSIIWTVMFSIDGSLLASGGRDSAIRVWNPQSGQQVQQLEGHSNTVNALAFNRQCSLIVSGSGDRTIRIWDLHLGRTSKRREDSFDVAHSMSVFTDNSSLTAEPHFDTSHLGGPRTSKDKAPGKRIVTMAFSPDGSLLASGSYDWKIRLWHTRTGQAVQKLEGHLMPVYAVVFSSDGSLLASGSYDQTVRVWTISMGHEVQKLEGHYSPVRAVTFSPGDAILASGSDDGTILLWATGNWQKVRKFKGHSSRIRSVAISPDGSLLASGFNDNTVQLWDVPGSQVVQTFENSLTRRILSFMNNTTLMIDTGPVRIEDTTTVGADDIPQTPLKTMIKMSGNWIQQNDQNLLWLPFEYRGEAEFCDNKLAIGAKSGLVSIFHLEYP